MVNYKNVVKSTGLLIFLSFMIFACSSEPEIKLTTQNLLAYGIPLSIMAPDSAEIKKEDWGAMQIVTVKKGEDYDLQIQSSEATTSDIATLKAQKIIDTKESRYFSKIVKEDPNGFIYETKPDSLTTFYGFQYIKIMGDREYVFRNGLLGNFTLEQTERMFESVKQDDH